MRITQKELKRMIIEEMHNLSPRKSHKLRLAEGSSANPVVVTPALLNQIIKEEFEAYQTRQRLAEAKKRSRLLKSRRRR